MTEVGTKLDLARAYIDMGDPEGARSILEEVLDEGDPGQRREAQSAHRRLERLSAARRPAREWLPALRAERASSKCRPQRVDADSLCRASLSELSTTAPTSSVGRSSARAAASRRCSRRLSARSPTSRSRCMARPHRRRCPCDGAGRALRHAARRARAAMATRHQLASAAGRRDSMGCGSRAATSTRAALRSAGATAIRSCTVRAAPRCAHARLVDPRTARLRRDDRRCAALARRARLLRVSRGGLPGEVADAPHAWPCESRARRAATARLVTCDFTANAFLQHMVRNLVGTLVEIGRGDLAPAAAATILASRDRTAGGVAAPPAGLTLVEVLYPRTIRCPWPGTSA